MPRLIKNILITGYLLLTFLGLVFSYARMELPVFVRPLVLWAYAMMAPFQSSSAINEQLVAIGTLPDGTTQHIALETYWPYRFPERNIRESLHGFQWHGPQAHRAKLQEMAIQLLEHERAHGRPYQRVALEFEAWDRSPAGFFFAHTPLFTRRERVADVGLDFRSLP